MKEKLHEIKQENYFLIIYLILIFLYYYANIVETNYVKYQNKLDLEKYRNLLYIIFGTSFLIALYYTISEYQKLKTINDCEVYKLEKISTIANLLILIATSLYLYIIYQDKFINIEVTL